MQARHVRSAETSRYIRKILKKAFPSVKFYVRSKSCITICWIDGPNLEQIKKLIRPFEGKSFDGMDDSTHYSYSWLLPNGTAIIAGYGKDLTPQPDGAELVCFSSYIFPERSYSKAFLETAGKEHAKDCGWAHPVIREVIWFPGPKSKGTVFEFVRDWEHQDVYRWFQEYLEAKTEFPEKEEKSA